MTYTKDPVPEQLVRGRVAKMSAISQLSSKWNPDKSVTYDCLGPGGEIVQRTVSYEDVCKVYGWKGFEVDALRCTPILYTQEEMDALEAEMHKKIEECKLKNQKKRGKKKSFLEGSGEEKK